MADVRKLREEEAAQQPSFALLTSPHISPADAIMELRKIIRAGSPAKYHPEPVQQVCFLSHSNIEPRETELK
jgi:hypothetical protein